MGIATMIRTGILLAALLAGACGQAQPPSAAQAQPTQASAAQAQPAQAQAAGASVTGLTLSGIQSCDDQGQQVAGYLDTGQPTSYDLNWGTQRQEVLYLKGESRALYIRQQADQVIANCAQQVAQAQQAAAQAQAEADLQNRIKAQKQASCAALGGVVQPLGPGMIDGCFPPPGRTTTDGVPCGGADLLFNNDGTISDSELRITKSVYVGCWN